MASSVTLPSTQTPLLKSSFLGKNQRHLLPHGQSTFPRRASSYYVLRPSAKFDLAQLLGGRGLCNGEQGLQKELRRTVEEISEPDLGVKGNENSGISEKVAADKIPEDGFEKELMGLTGGFPGGEKGLKKFISENPPPPKPSASDSGKFGTIPSTQKPNPPELPLLLPGMIAIVKNPNNPYYMYCGIVQRITDGKAGVLFEGGNWDRLITFRLEELERREKGPPMKNPRSAALEPFLQTDSQ